MYTKDDMMAILLDVLGKKGRARMLDVLKRYPRRDFSINELAKEAGMPVMSCWRAVKDFEAVGLVVVRSIGKASAVRLNEGSEIAKSALSALDLDEKDPYRTAARAFSKMLARYPWVERCILFGSVSRGTHKPGSDVDIAVVYDEKKIEKKNADLKVAEAVAKTGDSYGIRIVSLVLSKPEYSSESVRKLLKGGELLA